MKKRNTHLGLETCERCWCVLLAVTTVKLAPRFLNGLFWKSWKINIFKEENPEQNTKFSTEHFSTGPKN